jgi:hypothetical protein
MVMMKLGYPTDLTDKQWELIKEFFDKEKQKFTTT